MRHEFDGESNGVYSASGASVSLTPAAIKGSSGIGEIGTVCKPFSDDSLSLNSGIEVYTGKLSGFSALMSSRYSF